MPNGEKPIQMLECKDGNWRALDYPKEGVMIGACITKEDLGDVDFGLLFCTSIGLALVCIFSPCI